MQDEFKIYVAGKFVRTNRELNVINPYSGKQVATTFLGDKKDLESAIEKGESLLEELKNLSSWKKFEILKYISEQLKLNRQNLALLLCRESAKPLRYALAEIDRAAQTFLVAAEESKRIPKEFISLDWTSSNEGKEGLVKYFPVGLIGGISPFNFPMNLAVHKIAPAIAVGCPIILKPASATPLSTLALAKIIHETDLPRGAVSVIPMDRKTGNLLVCDERIKLLSFTGSPEVGWEMKKNASKKKIVLELGGNAGVIVTESSDLNRVVPKAIVGAFAYSGQICIHAQRFFIHESIFESFVSKFIAATKKIKYGNPEKIETEISSMIDEENAKRVEDWVKEAKKAGAQILLGAERKRNYFPPTIITKTKKEMKVCSHEIFGPVVTLEKYNSFEEAVDMINDSDFGLQAGVFTQKISEMNYAHNNIETGGVIINDVPTFRADHMPYGGIKNSGLGREGVKYAMMDMLEPRILVK